MESDKVEEFKSKIKLNSTYYLEDLKEYITYLFKDVNFKDNEIFFKISDRRNGYIYYEEYRNNKIKILEIDTEVYKLLGLASDCEINYF